MPLDVFIHTDGHISQPPSSSGYRASTFWSGQMRDLSEYKKQWDCCYRAPTNVDACFKYESILNVSASSAAGPSWLGLLSDSDVVFQCSAKELKNKFRRFGVPLVVSGERRWYPLPRNLPDPFGPVNGTWKQRYKLRHTYQYYPNSGLIMGSRFGFEALATAIRTASPSFPCCSFEGDKHGWSLDACSSCRPMRYFPKPVSCAVEDQACAQVALSSRQHAPQHAVDTNATLFLSLNQLTIADLVRNPDGRIAFKPTGEVPCVLHANGDKEIFMQLAWRSKGSLSPEVVWAPRPGLGVRSHKGCGRGSHDCNGRCVDACLGGAIVHEASCQCLSCQCLFNGDLVVSA